MFDIHNLGYVREGKSILSCKRLSVERGEHLLLLGASGCGKTTLMNLMAGLVRPSSGNIIFESQNYADLSDLAMDKLRVKNFGFVFQRLHLIGHLSVTQNIVLALERPDHARVMALIEELGLSGKAQQKARDLSVGEAQRVAIARGVVNAPKVIFADEPSSALDDVNTDKVMDLLFAQAKKAGETLIVATHDARIKGRFSNIWEMAA